VPAIGCAARSAIGESLRGKRDTPSLGER